MKVVVFLEETKVMAFHHTSAFEHKITACGKKLSIC